MSTPRKLPSFSASRFPLPAPLHRRRATAVCGTPAGISELPPPARYRLVIVRTNPLTTLTTPRTARCCCSAVEAAGEHASPPAATMFWLIRAFSSAIFLLSIVLSIPIAFDVGGRDAGLAYSLSLFLFYAFYSFSKLLTPERSRVRWFFSKLVGWSQWIVLPALLIWALNRFSVDAGTDWVSRTLAHVTTRPKATSWSQWFFGQQGVVETVALGGWDNMLSYSSPVFQLLEGFCSLLVIQAAGQITRWLVNRGRSDTWVVRCCYSPRL